MIINGYCPFCDTKIIEVKAMGYFDEFSFKCCKCKKIVENHRVKYKKKHLTKRKKYARLEIG